MPTARTLSTCQSSTKTRLTLLSPGCDARLLTVVGVEQLAPWFSNNRALSPRTNVRSFLRRRLVGQAGLCRRANEDNAEHLPYQVQRVLASSPKTLSAVTSATTPWHRFVLLCLCYCAFSPTPPHGASKATGKTVKLGVHITPHPKLSVLCVSGQAHLRFLVNNGIRCC